MATQGTTMFAKYFRAFQNNAEKAHRYQLVLSGEVVCGIPVAEAGSDEAGTFEVRLSNGRTRTTRWEHLLTACQL